MAQKEGRCPNCGSILRLNPSSEKGHCLFCDAVFNNEKAFEIAENPAGYEFPNEPQPKYEGPDLNSGSKKKGAAEKKVAKEPVQPTTKAKRKPPAKAYTPSEPVKLPPIKLPKRIRKKAILAVVLFFVLLFGIGTPVIMARNEAREEILERLPQVVPFEVEGEQTAVIRRLNNSYLLIVAPEQITEDEMVELFKGFAETRADVRDEDMGDFRRVYGRVTVKLISPDGGYILSSPASEEELYSHEAIRETS